VVTPKPVASPKPIKVSPEEPPAKANGGYCQVRVYLTPANVDAKVYLVNGPSRFMEQGAGSVRLQPDKKGTYTLKILAPGYETFSKEVKVSGEHKLAVRLEKVPAPTYVDPGTYPAPGPGPAPYNPPPAYYPPPAPAPAPYQIPAPNI
jgi:hypothetical protein